MTVRSANLAAVTLAASTNTVLFTCPDGYTTILKTIWMANFTGAAASVTVWVHIPPSGTYEIFQNSNTPAGIEGQLQTWVVLAPGHQLMAFSNVGNITVHASGSILLGIPPAF